MITFDSLTLKAWIKENTDFLTGARIQKIQQPTRKDFIFTLRNNSRTRKLYLNINPQFYHLCFMSGDNELKRDFEIPKQPPMFCMLLRKYLENSLICKVNQPQYERIFELYIETYNELSEKIYLCLAVELMGKHSNVILYNHDTNIILGCAHNVGPEKSRERELAGTFPYVYPPVLHKTDITLYNGELNYETLYKDFYWISKSFQKQCKNVSLNDLKKLVNAEDFSPAISKDYTEYTLFSNLIEKPILQNSVNVMLDNYYSFYMQKDKYNSLKRNIIGNINSQIKRNSATLKKMSEKLNAAKDNDKNRLYADLIMSALYNNSDYSDCINIYDYENGENIKIHLDKTLTLKENANKFYKIYNKTKVSIQKLGEMYQNLESKTNYLKDILYSAEISSDINDLREIESEIYNNENKTPVKKILNSPLEFCISGQKVLVGKNNKQNDLIVSKLSDNNDYWFHTKNCPGSHVLLKYAYPDEKMIYECAKLAKEYSSASKSSKVSVIYTKRINLKKPPKAALGYVTYKNEKEIVV